MLTDLTTAMARRTTGFELAVETGFRYFRLVQAPVFINSELRRYFHIEFIGMAVLLLASFWILWRMRSKIPADNLRKQWAQWLLLIVFLIGGVAFFVLMTQATVTATFVVFKVILPFIGLLIGYSLINVNGGRKCNSYGGTNATPIKL